MRGGAAAKLAVWSTAVALSAPASAGEVALPEDTLEGNPWEDPIEDTLNDDSGLLTELAHVLGGELTFDSWVLASESYRVRGVLFGDQSGTDQDVRLLIDGGAQTISGELSLSASAALYWDIDGADTTGGLYSVRDTDSGLELDLYNLEARYEAQAVRRLSVGRLTVDNGWPLVIDGVAAELSPAGFLPRSRAFGLGESSVHLAAGRTVHFYEKDGDLFEDWVLSSALELRLWNAVKLLFDYGLLVDDKAARTADHSYGGTLFLRLGDVVNARLYARGINDALARLGAQGAFALPAYRVGVDVAVHAQTVALNELAESLDPIYAVLGTSNPFARANARLWARQKLSVAGFDLADGGIALGVNGRLSLFGPDEAFNRTYGRLYLTGDVQDVGVPGLYAALNVESHFANRFDDEGLLALGGEAGYSRDWFKLRAGTAYQRYKYRYFRQLEEIANVRSVFASSSVRYRNNLRFSARYDLELTDRVVHTLSVTVSQNLGLSL